MVDVPVGNENAVKKAVVMKVEVFDPVMVPYPSTGQSILSVNITRLTASFIT